VNRFLDPFSLRYVANDLRRTDDVTLGAADRRYGKRNRYVRPVFPPADGLEIIDILIAADPPK
jgi:hypothetical protein